MVVPCRCVAQPVSLSNRRDDWSFSKYSRSATALLTQAYKLSQAFKNHSSGFHLCLHLHTYLYKFLPWQHIKLKGTQSLSSPLRLFARRLRRTIIEYRLWLKIWELQLGSGNRCYLRYRLISGAYIETILEAQVLILKTPKAAPILGLFMSPFSTLKVPNWGPNIALA